MSQFQTPCPPCLQCLLPCDNYCLMKDQFYTVPSNTKVFWPLSWKLFIPCIWYGSCLCCMIMIMYVWKQIWPTVQKAIAPLANAMSEVPLELECSGCGSYKLERYSAGKRSLAMAAAAVPAEARRQRGRTSRSVSPCSRLAMTTILRNRDGAVKQHVPIFNWVTSRQTNIISSRQTPTVWLFPKVQNVKREAPDPSDIRPLGVGEVLHPLRQHQEEGDQEEPATVEC